VTLAVIATATMLLLGNVESAGAARYRPTQFPKFEARSLDGFASNSSHREWAWAGTPYLRVAPANYADRAGSMVAGPNARVISNRIFNDVGQNLFSETGESQWGWTWGQFLDHDLGLRDETPGEPAPIAFDTTDPFESFANDFGALGFSRTPAAPHTGSTSRRSAHTRQQINTISSVIDASNVYGVTSRRLEWLRAGPVDSNLSNNSASLMLPGGYLPTVMERGDASSAPAMDLMGLLAGAPNNARVAGDVRANENIALTSVQTLFAREHNRIVAALPATLSDQTRFDIARRVVGAEVQYITYNEFLPSLGVKLSRYRGYNSRVNPTLSNEFATVGYRAHSMVHGEFDVDFEAGDYSAGQLAAWQAEGIKVVDTPGEHHLTIPLTVAFGNPGLLQEIGLQRWFESLGAERQYRNDEQIDNSMRSVMFEVPEPGTTDPAACQTPVVDPRCFNGVADLGADDVQRGRDHGMPGYNDMRRAYGLRPVKSFSEITGETPRASSVPLTDPHSLDFTELRDAGGNIIPLGSDTVQEEAVSGVRRTTLAARLESVYGNVDAVDAFVGMISEPHLKGSDLGALQSAMWKRQFTATRDGDRFFYGNDPVLQRIRQTYGVSYKHSLADLIHLDAQGTVPPDVFEVGP
jgi:hypothetical protein